MGLLKLEAGFSYLSLSGCIGLTWDKNKMDLLLFIREKKKIGFWSLWRKGKKGGETDGKSSMVMFFKVKLVEEKWYNYIILLVE